MPTLHIEHPISDYAVWQQAFDRFAERRSEAGVLAARIGRPVDDERYILVDLDFATVQQAEGYRTFLVTQVWTNPKNSPGLAGSPRTVIVENQVRG